MFARPTAEFVVAVVVVGAWVGALLFSPSAHHASQSAVFVCLDCGEIYIRDSLSRYLTADIVEPSFLGSFNGIY